MSNVSIKTAERLLKRVFLSNIFAPNDSNVTPLLSGTYGVGKTAICKTVAKKLGGACLVIEGGSLKEGELTGNPLCAKRDDGEMEVTFIKYFSIKDIERLQKLHYETYTTVGFLNGTVKQSTKETDDKTTTKLLVPSVEEQKNTLFGLSGDNKYEWGNELAPETKLKLLQSKEIIPVVIFIDEILRADGQVSKELMNISLTKTINGYRLPWWVFFVAATNPAGQDSKYATNELDPAQLDRFLKIKISSDFNETLDYFIDNGMDDTYLMALSAAPEIFQDSGKGLVDNEEEAKPSPRSHCLCSIIYGKREVVSNSGFFTPEERKFEEKDVSELIIDKLGRNDGRVLLSNIRNRDNMIDPKDIINGKSDKIDSLIAQKIDGMGSLPKRLLVKNIVKYFSKNTASVYFDAASKKEGSKESNTKWINILAQITDLMSHMDNATQVVFAKDCVSTKLDLPEKYNTRRLNTVYKLVYSVLTEDINQQLVSIDDAKNSLDINSKE